LEMQLWISCVEQGQKVNSMIHEMTLINTKSLSVVSCKFVDRLLTVEKTSKDRINSDVGDIGLWT
jgi:hypothetical protein